MDALLSWYLSFVENVVVTIIENPWILVLIILVAVLAAVGAAFEARR